MAAGLIEYSPIHVIQGVGAPGQGSPNPDAAPSCFFMGVGMQDPRVPYNPASGTDAIQAFYGTPMIKTASAAPAAAAVANIAAAQVAASGTPLNLVAASGAGIIKMATASAVRGSGNTIPVGSLAIEAVPVYQAFGQGFITGFYLPSSGVARAVSVTAAASATGGVVRIRGADLYGTSMTEDITAVAASTVNGKKAFKFIFSATPTFTDGTHNYSVGTTDIFGLSLRASNFADVLAYFDSILLLKATFVTPDTATATATTGDVRGTIAVPSASDGVKHLDLFVIPTLANVITQPVTTGMFGVPQFNA